MDHVQPYQPPPYGRNHPVIQDPYKAISDPIRRHLLEQLCGTPKSVNEMAGGLAISRPAVSQHLKILLEARLVSVRAYGTRRVYAVNKDGFRELQEWVHAVCTDGY